MHRRVLLTLVVFLLAACSTNASQAAGPTGSTGQGTGTTGNTGTAAPTSLAPATTAPTTGPTGNTGAGYLNRQQVETYMNGIANVYQSTNLNWHYSKKNGDYESNTDDQYCDFSLVNSEGESASLIDNLLMNCGDSANGVTREETTETAHYEASVIQQFAGAAAATWFAQEVNKGGSSGSVSGDETFGPVAVIINLSANGFDVMILSNGT